MSGEHKAFDTKYYERAFDLIQRLQAGQRLNAHIIARICDVHVRTAYRILNAMEISLPVRRIGGNAMGAAFLVWNR